MNTEADCVALYNWKINPSWDEWFAFCNKFFRTLNLVPDTALAGKSADKMKPFDFDASCSLKATKSNWKAVQIYSTHPGYKQLIFGWKACAAITVEDQHSIVVGWEAGRLDRETVMAEALELTSDCYAIGYQRSFKLGPDIYAYGMASGLAFSRSDMEEKDRIGAWLRERIGQNRHLCGLLRDVFPHNVLMDSHLSQKVGSVSLKSWLQEKSGRGQLSLLRPNQWMWKLTADEIKHVRPTLSNAGLLIADSD